MKLRFGLTAVAKDFVSRMKKVAVDWARHTEAGSKAASELYILDLQKFILAQQMANRRLSPRWSRYKALRGLDARTLMATGTYLTAFQPRKAGDGMYGVVVVGVTARTGEEYITVGGWHENGAKRADPRPHWRPVLEAHSQKYGYIMMTEVLRAAFGD